MIFNTIQNQLESNQFTIVSMDHHRPCGGFFVIAEEQAQDFAISILRGWMFRR